MRETKKCCGVVVGFVLFKDPSSSEYTFSTGRHMHHFLIQWEMLAETHAENLPFWIYVVLCVSMGCVLPCQSPFWIQRLPTIKALKV